MTKPLSFADFVVEMDEVLREARDTGAVDDRGRSIDLYYGDMMERLSGALDLVNARITARGGLTFSEYQAVGADHQPHWKRGDRVKVLYGAHEGRTGTVNILPSDPEARYIKIGADQVRVALDGEPGEVACGSGAVARGGRGGVSIVIAATDLEGL